VFYVTLNSSTARRLTRCLQKLTSSRKDWSISIRCCDWWLRWCGRATRGVAAVGSRKHARVDVACASAPNKAPARFALRNGASSELHEHPQLLLTSSTHTHTVNVEAYCENKKNPVRFTILKSRPFRTNSMSAWLIDWPHTLVNRGHSRHTLRGGIPCPFIGISPGGRLLSPSLPLYTHAH
jgi:hypothetical protein